MGVRGRCLSFMWVVAVALSGCATSRRVAVAPTVDTAGKWGPGVGLTVALGESYRGGRAAVLVAADVGGAVDERVGGHGGVGVGVDALGESRRVGFRMGVTVAGRVVVPGEGRVGVGGAVGGRIAVLPVVRYVHRGDGRAVGCGGGDSWTWWHVGVELSGQYLWGADARGLFGAGAVFEVDALARTVCD
jgi:hypothetical protein